MTLEDEMRLEQMRKLGLVPPQQPSVTSPGQVRGPAEYQAQQLEPQVAPQPTGPQTWKDALLLGVQGAMSPRMGGVTGILAGRDAAERQRQQDVYARVKDLRNEGRQQQQDYNTEQDRAANLEQVKRLRDIEEQKLNMPAPVKASMGAQGTYYTDGPDAGKLITPAEKPPVLPKASSGALGTYYQEGPDAGKIITPAPDKSTQDSLITVRTVGPGGKPVTMIVPKKAGASYDSPPTAQEDNRRSQADIINEYADHILSMIDKNPEAVGPILGRIARGETAIGNVSPEAKAIGTALGSLVALQPILHGFRGGSQTVDHFNLIVGDQHLNAAALKASINEIKSLAGTVAEGVGKTQSGVPAGEPQRTRIKF